MSGAYFENVDIQVARASFFLKRKGVRGSRAFAYLRYARWKAKVFE
jgi:hypothetical protein